MDFWESHWVSKRHTEFCVSSVIRHQARAPPAEKVTRRGSKTPKIGRSLTRYIERAGFPRTPLVVGGLRPRPHPVRSPMANSLRPLF
jgi:hypothetical protein